jgi:hypothetical protein
MDGTELVHLVLHDLRVRRAARSHAAVSSGQGHEEVTYGTEVDPIKEEQEGWRTVMESQ